MTNLKERPLYLAIMALPIALGSIIGPIIGALLCQFVTWRWLGWYGKQTDNTLWNVQLSQKS